MPMYEFPQSFFIKVALIVMVSMHLAVLSNDEPLFQSHHVDANTESCLLDEDPISVSRTFSGNDEREFQSIQDLPFTEFHVVFGSYAYTQPAVVLSVGSIPYFPSVILRI